MSELSPAAQAIRQAAYAAPVFSAGGYALELALAAALRELAKRIRGAYEIRQDVLDIAQELDPQ